jgi:hypothetical protein
MGSPNGAGCGGVCILVSPYLKHMIVSSRSVRDNQAMWVTLSGTSVGKIGILNVYAPNISKAQGRLWDNLAFTLDPSHAWMMEGDWNMTENSANKFRGCGQTLSQLESLWWNFF